MLLAAAAAALLLLTFPGALRLRNPDEPRDCEIGREWADGGWSVIPHLNGEPYWSKPPLFHISVGCAMAATGSRGEALLGPGLGLLAGLMLLATHYFFLRFRIATTDTAFAALLTLSMLGFFLAQGAGRTRWWIVMGTAAGLASLAKGAHGLLFPFLAAAAFLVAKGEGRKVAGPRFLGALLLGTALFAVWLTVLRFDEAEGGGPGLVREFLLGNLERRFGEAAHHEEPWYHYGSLAGRALPWTFVAVAGAWAALRGARGERDRLLGPLLWLVVVVLALSVASGKRSVYLLPVLPAAALLATGAVDAAARGALPKWPGRLVRWSIDLLSLPVRWTPLARRGLPGRAAAAALLVAAGNLAYALAVVGPASRADSGEPLARRAAEIAGSRPLVLFRAARGEVGLFTFPLDRTLPEAKDAGELRRVAAGAPVVLLARSGLPEQAVERGFLPKSLFDRWVVVGQGEASGDPFRIDEWDGR